MLLAFEFTLLWVIWEDTLSTDDLLHLPYSLKNQIIYKKNLTY